MSAERGIRDTAKSIGLTIIDHISFAVTDLEATIPHYEALFGSFEVAEAVFSPERLSYRGRPTAVVFRLAFCRDVVPAVELVQVLEGETPNLEYLRDHGEGLHHVCFLTADLDQSSERMLTEGYTETMRGETLSGIRFSYLENPTYLGHSVIELVQPGPSDPRHHRLQGGDHSL